MQPVEVFDLAKVWFEHNNFKIKKEIPETLFKAIKGSLNAHIIEMRLSKLSAGNFVSIHGNKQDEVMRLVTFLKSSVKNDPTIAGNEKVCIFCGGNIRASSLFCDKCGKKQE